MEYISLFKGWTAISIRNNVHTDEALAGTGISNEIHTCCKEKIIFARNPTPLFEINTVYGYQNTVRQYLPVSESTSHMFICFITLKE